MVDGGSGFVGFLGIEGEMEEPDIEFVGVDEGLELIYLMAKCPNMAFNPVSL